MQDTCSNFLHVIGRVLFALRTWSKEKKMLFFKSNELNQFVQLEEDRLSPKLIRITTSLKTVHQLNQ